MVIMNIIDKIQKDIILYCPIYGDVKVTWIGHEKFEITSIEGDYKIFLNPEGKLYTKNGVFTNGKCLIFPSKDNEDWESYISKFNINTLEPFDKVLVRDDNKHCWSACLYSHYEDYGDTRFFISDAISWNQCIPYNDETKNLVGTIKMPDSYYITWQ